MTGDAGTPLTAKWQIIELDEAQGIGSVEIEDGFTLRHEISFHFGDESEFRARNDDFFSSLLDAHGGGHHTQYQAGKASICAFAGWLLTIVLHMPHDREFAQDYCTAG